MERALVATGIDVATIPESWGQGLKATARDICESHYEGLDVCASGGAESAVARLEGKIKINEMLFSDSSMRGNEVVAQMVADAKWELLALKSLIAAPSTYCDVATTSATPSSGVTGEPQESGGGHEAFVQRCIDNRVGRGHEK